MQPLLILFTCLSDMKTMMLVFANTILLGMLYQHVECYGQFNGGSMSYVMEKQPDGNQLVTIELITGWVLGKGPCGSGCTESDIGRSTRLTRPQMVSSNPYYLGTFSKEQTSNFSTVLIPMDARVNSTYNETVIAVSEKGKWEQEIMLFSVIMEKDIQKMDIIFSGFSWRQLSLVQTSKKDIEWHFQTKIFSRVRSDTNSTNQSPKALSKPFYRVKLDRVTQIRLQAVDGDGDFIKCKLSEYSEGGAISIHPPPLVQIMENCFVFINASRAIGYEDNTWIAVPVSVRDYNRKDILYGTQHYAAGKYSLSTTAVQFVVQITDNLTPPVFVEPSYEGNHVFIMYSGTEWRTKIYAEASENTTIGEFTTYGISGENFTSSNAQQDPKRSQVMFTIMSWKPSVTDVGRHIACVCVTDSTGVDSDEQRCFTLDVRPDVFNHSSTNKPYFVDIPSPDQLVACKIHATCVVALYVKSGVDVSEIHVTDSYIDKYEIGPIQSLTHKGQTVYNANLSFEHSMYGKERICLKAKDVNGGESEDVCITSYIEPPAKCLSCDYTSGLSYCDEIMACSDNQTCYVQSFTNLNGHTHYRSGCIDYQTCHLNEHGNSSKGTCLQCCEGDFCNSHGCGDNGFPPKQSRGPLCLDCSHVSDPKECDKITICSSNEVCRIEEFPWGDDSIFHLGCASVNDCAIEHRSLNPFNQRSVPVCTECCQEDYCNTNCTGRTHNQQQIIVG